MRGVVIAASAREYGEYIGYILKVWVAANERVFVLWYRRLTSYVTESWMKTNPYFLAPLASRGNHHPHPGPSNRTNRAHCPVRSPESNCLWGEVS